MFEHKTAQVPGFTKKYRVERLVWWEAHEDINVAITREKRIKRWRRDWKTTMIERENPDWIDLFASIGGTEPAGLAPLHLRNW